MRILVVEDDVVQADSLEKALSNAFADISFSRVATVAELRMWLRDLSPEERPDLIILDGIVPWSRPAEASKDDLGPAELDNPYHGGRECLRLFSRSRTTIDTPVIAYTILEKEKIFGRRRTPPLHVFHVRKTGGFDELVVHIRSLMLGEPTEKEPTLKDRVSDAVAAKPGWFGFSIDLKKLFGLSERSS